MQQGKAAEPGYRVSPWQPTTLPRDSCGRDASLYARIVRRSGVAIAAAKRPGIENASTSMSHVTYTGRTSCTKTVKSAEFHDTQSHFSVTQHMNEMHWCPWGNISSAFQPFYSIMNLIAVTVWSTGNGREVRSVGALLIGPPVVHVWVSAWPIPREVAQRAKGIQVPMKFGGDVRPWRNLLNSRNFGSSFQLFRSPRFGRSGPLSARRSRRIAPTGATANSRFTGRAVIVDL